MNLDDLGAFRQLDREDMLSHIDGLPDQLEKAWELGVSLPLSPMQGIRHILVAGMGGSAIGADLLSSYVAPFCPVPVVVHRDYDLPNWARGQETLVICSSHSGNTEETLSAFEMAQINGCRLMVISTGGAISEKARAANVPLWNFEHKGQPRAAVGFSFGLLLAALVKAGIVADADKDVRAAIAAMRREQQNLRADVPVTKNPVKRLAGQLVGRYVSFFGSGFMKPVARRWKTQANEIAKAWAQFEFLPEADHNTLAGVVTPPDLLPKITAVFLQSSFDHERNKLRADLTRQGLMMEGISTDFYNAKGETTLEQMWTAVHFGDYLAYYLAMAYEVDPTPVEAIEGLKKAMKR